MSYHLGISHFYRYTMHSCKFCSALESLGLFFFSLLLWVFWYQLNITQKILSTVNLVKTCKGGCTRVPRYGVFTQKHLFCTVSRQKKTNELTTNGCQVLQCDSEDELPEIIYRSILTGISIIYLYLNIPFLYAHYKWWFKSYTAYPISHL